MSVITSLFASFWRLFTDLRVPLLGISFSSLWLGVFVVSFSIRILFPLLGIGSSALSSASRGSDRLRSLRLRQSRQQYYDEMNRRNKSKKED